MGLTWLNNRNWSDITRDERFFCAHLYKTVLAHGAGIPGFVRLINKACKLDLPVDANWELGYEVCFYRDLSFDDPARFGEALSPKRTFDLCLFSDEMIVIIEAKAYQPFDLAQTSDFVADIDRIENRLKLPVKVVLAPLASSLYEKTYLRSDVRTKGFNCDLLTWAQLAREYESSADSSILQKADLCFGRRPPVSDKTKKYVTGRDLLQLSQDAAPNSEHYWVGRGQGLKGLRADLIEGVWPDRLYEVTIGPATAPNKNWFSLEQFVEAVSVNL